MTVDRRVNPVKFEPTAQRVSRNELVEGPKTVLIDYKAGPEPASLILWEAKAGKLRRIPVQITFGRKTGGGISFKGPGSQDVTIIHQVNLGEFGIRRFAKPTGIQAPGLQDR